MARVIHPLERKLAEDMAALFAGGASERAAWVRFLTNPHPTLDDALDLMCARFVARFPVPVESWVRVDADNRPDRWARVVRRWEAKHA